jgi:predicted DNA-binding antitoxin AbrB/MazE fold protein
MEKTIRARFNKGVIEPLEKLDLEEGTEVNITITPLSKIEDVLEVLKDTSGAWKGTIDTEELKKNIYSDRLITTRPDPKI